MGLKLDITKAFDTIEWGFLFQVLKNFGFSSQFISWVSTLLHSPHLSILVNGTLRGFFSCNIGVRQGDPLSPLLFCLAEEALSRDILNLREQGSVRGISSPRPSSSSSHALYADDIFIFVCGDYNSLSNLKGFLESYSRDSGQVINKAKSWFFISLYMSHMSNFLKSFLGFQEGLATFTYLGVLIFRGIPRKQHLQVIADRV